jgi:putative sterol carrier protein
MSIEAFFAAVPEAQVVSALPDGVSVAFELTGEGGGNWTVAREGSTTRVEPGSSAHPDCRLRCSVDDFRRLVNGELEPRRGFLEGRFSVEGDVGLVWRLRRSVGQER